MRTSYEEALEMLINRITPISETEKTHYLDSFGRVLGEDVIAPFDQPPFPRSPLDGYAVRSEDIQGASKDNPVRLIVLGEEDAGYVIGVRVESGTAIRIMTGAPIPEGADCVVKQELTNYGEDGVEIYASFPSNSNICEQGEDFKCGTVLLSAGDKVNPASVGVIASVGKEYVEVIRRPRVILISSGDEIIEPGEELRPGVIYDSNLPLMCSNLRKWGAELIFAVRARDNPETVAKYIEENIEAADLVITTGGVSVGKKDIMHDVYDLLEVERVFWGVDIKPGMPTLTGVYHDTPVISLSGNPYGVVVTAELFVKAALARLSSDPDIAQNRLTAELTDDLGKMIKSRRFLRGNYDNGKVSITDSRSANGTLSTVCRSNCLIDVPGGTEKLSRGDIVRVIMM